MARKTLTRPRKIATQQRSRSTVDALLDATARILVREGFDKASTNRIAEVAGVSVGSLYQYFPGKEALVVAVAERHRQEIMQTVQGELAQVRALPLKSGVRQLVTVAIKAHGVDPRLHHVLAEQIPRAGKLEKLPTFDSDNFVLFKAYLEQHRKQIRVVDLDLAAFICVTAIEALTHNAVLHHSKMMAGTRMNALIDEGTRLVCGYLQR
jgi:AcrR family transcriptional regulator